MNDRNITLPVVVKQSHKDGLQALASKTERSLSYFAREAIDDLLAKYGLTKGAGLTTLGLDIEQETTESEIIREALGD